jgi:hypothetical protein
MKRFSVAVPLVLLAALLAIQHGSARTLPQQALPPSAYLPLVYQPRQPAEAPTPDTVPPPEGACGQTAPPAAEGLQAWMTNPTPPQNSTITLCVWLIVGGDGAHLASTTALVRYKTSERTLGPVSTRNNGSAALPFSIGRATIGYTVLVDVVVEAEGQRYTAQTSFTPIQAARGIARP